MYWILVLATLAICAQLWRMGGNGHDLCRNPGVPIVLGCIKIPLLLYSMWSWNVLWALVYIPALWAMIQAFSYGVTAPPHKFWVWVIGTINGKYNNPAWRGMADNGQIPGVEIATRCTCGFFWSLPAAIFAMLTGRWILFAVYVLFLTIINGLIWLFIQDVEKNERAVGACVATGVII